MPKPHDNGALAEGAPSYVEPPELADPASVAHASVNEWVNVVRRARLHPDVKLTALLLASYADKHGANIYPGVSRLAVQSGHGYRTVQRALATLRKLGFIEAMPRAGAPRGWKTGYRLILAADLLEKTDVPTPAAEDMAVEALASRERQRTHPKHATVRHPEGVPPDTTIRHPEGVPSDDRTPEPSRRPYASDPPLTSDKVGATHHVPLPIEQPTIDRGAVDTTRTGIARARENGRQRDLNSRENREGETLACRRCNGRYALTPDGRHGHRVVFGHEPQ